MDREGIRKLAAETLKLPTAKYAFADSLDELKKALKYTKLPVIIKPLMSSSGKAPHQDRGRHSQFLECFSARESQWSR